MKQILLIGLVLITKTLLTSCEKNLSSVPNTIQETTWTVIVTNSKNTTSSTVLKFYESTYEAITTDIKEGRNQVQTRGGRYAYNPPNVSMVVGSGESNDVVMATLFDNETLHVVKTTYVFKRQF